MNCSLFMKVGVGGGAGLRIEGMTSIFPAKIMGRVIFIFEICHQL